MEPKNNQYTTMIPSNIENASGLKKYDPGLDNTFLMEYILGIYFDMFV